MQFRVYQLYRAFDFEFIVETKNIISGDASKLRAQNNHAQLIALENKIRKLEKTEQKGPSGPQGDKGEKGIKGSEGITGNKGPNGYGGEYKYLKCMRSFIKI